MRGWEVGGVGRRYSTSKRKEQRIPAMVRALVAVAPDSLKPACLATATSFCAWPMSRHSAAKMNGSNLKISLEPVSIMIMTLVCFVVLATMNDIHAGHAVGIVDYSSRHSVGWHGVRCECAHIQKQKFCTFDEDCMLVVKESHA